MTKSSELKARKEAALADGVATATAHAVRDAADRKLGRAVA
jgi:hypothetical protein